MEKEKEMLRITGKRKENEKIITERTKGKRKEKKEGEAKVAKNITREEEKKTIFFELFFFL